MRKLSLFVLLVLVTLVLSPGASFAQELRGRQFKGQVMVPASSLEHPGDAGFRAHTHLRILVPREGRFEGAAQHAAGAPPVLGLFFETPASIACVYRLVPDPKPGCNPDETTEPPTGGGGAVALVEAFDDPTAAADLQTFSTQFGFRSLSILLAMSNASQRDEYPAFCCAKSRSRSRLKTQGRLTAIRFL